MSGKWGNCDIPQRGWSCTDIHDLGAPSQTCAMCEVQIIRYVHTMEHPAFADALEVGCICAGYMEEDEIGARRRENDFKRRQRWLARPWALSRAGNEYINRDGFNVVIFPRDGLWGARVKHCDSGVQLFTPRPSPTAGQAKLAAFDLLQQMQVAAIAKPRADPMAGVLR